MNATPETAIRNASICVIDMEPFPYLERKDVMLALRYKCVLMDGVNEHRCGIMLTKSMTTKQMGKLLQSFGKSLIDFADKQESVGVYVKEAKTQ